VKVGRRRLDAELVLAVARAHGTTPAVEWAQSSTSTVVQLRRDVDGYTRGRGHPTRAEMEARAPRPDCDCPMCVEVRDGQYAVTERPVEPRPPRRRRVPRCGTRAAYAAGCHCPACRAAGAEYMRSYRRQHAPQADARTTGLRMPPLTDAERDMVTANTGLISKVLQLRHTPEHQWEDAYQDGMFGLMRAAQKFDPAKGFTFATYAVFWIRQAVGRGAETFEGINYRRTRPSKGGTGVYVPPVSLDAPMGDADEVTGADRLAAIDDPESDALAAESYERLLALCRRACRDELDRKVLAGLISGESVAVIATAAGVSRGTVAMRRERIATYLRHPAFGLNRAAA
jgi:RNA polymerase sigma factor (sigma-70 family)